MLHLQPPHIHLSTACSPELISRLSNFPLFYLLPMLGHKENSRRYVYYTLLVEEIVNASVRGKLLWTNSDRECVKETLDLSIENGTFAGCRRTGWIMRYAQDGSGIDPATHDIYKHRIRISDPRSKYNWYTYIDVEDNLIQTSAIDKIVPHREGVIL